jgi:hypothetical protein
MLEHLDMEVVAAATHQIPIQARMAVVEHLSTMLLLAVLAVLYA